MSLFIFTILNFIMSFVFAQEQATIIDYNSSHKKSVIALAFEDQDKFFLGNTSPMLKLFTPVHEIEKSNRETLEELFNDDSIIKKIIIIPGTFWFSQDNVIGFIAFKKESDISLEDLENNDENVQELMIAMATINGIEPKKTKAECNDFITLKALVISQNYRRKGFATKLLHHMFASMPASIKNVKIEVNSDNVEAIKFFEAEGFSESEFQSAPLQMLNGIAYEKEIN